MKVPEQEGFFELSVPYSETWPPSGSMRNGRAWQRRRSALPTDASASSSTPGRLMPTPRTSDTNGAGTHGDGGMDLRTAVSLLPTPAARDYKSGESNLIGTNSRPLNEVVVNLLPTPRATRGGSATETMYSLGAERTDDERPQGEVLLPTPTASNPNDGESLESWEARRRRNLAKGINGNGQGTPLAIAVKLLPTPRASDGTKGGPNQRGSKGDLMLPSAAAQLLPTPTTADGERTSSTYGRGNPTLTGAITNPPSAAGKPSSDDPPPGPPTLWDD